MQNTDFNNAIPPQREDKNEFKPEIEEFDNKLNFKLYMKIAIIGVLILLLLIPKLMIEEQISTREYTAENAMKDVFTQWGNKQTFTGPWITISKEFNIDGKTPGTTLEKKYLNILPNKLNINTEVNSNELKRGIYEIVTYTSEMEISGSFIIEDEMTDLLEKYNDGNATLSISVPDLKGISEEVVMEFGDKKLRFAPNGSGLTFDDSKKMSAKIDQKALIPNQEIPFKMSLKLKGSQSLMFTPVARTTNVKINSNCKTPSFNGSFIPNSRNVTENGFQAEWSVLFVNRNYPQFGENMKNEYHGEFKNSEFGVNFLLPVQHYQKTTRSVKYALLIIILTFAAYFFIEMIQKKNVNIIQYTLVGLALVLFYSLLLSFSEHIGFTNAYIVSAIMTITMLTLYTAGILKIRKTAFLIGGALALLYAYIFVLLQMETYALLAGSIGLFVILGIIMYFSQKIKWNIK